MPDPQHDPTTSQTGQAAGTDRKDFTVTLVGFCTPDAWERLAADLEEIRQQQHP